MAAPSTVLASRLLVRARLRHLQVFVKVAEVGSVQRAAAAVGLTQPSTTHALGELEKLLECALFQRHSRGVTPTRVAIALLPLARKVLDTIDDCADVVAAVARSADGVVRLAAISGAVTGLLARVLPAFSRQHPDVLVQVRELAIEQIGTILGQGDADLVLCRRPAVVPQGWSFAPLLEDRLVVVCSPEHRLAGKRRVRLDQLWDETWLQGALASAPRRAFDALVAAAGVEPRLRMVSTRSPSILWAMLQADDVISLVPFSVARQLLDAGQLALVDVPIPGAFEPIGVMTREHDPGAATQTLRRFLEQAENACGPERARRIRRAPAGRAGRP